MSEKILKKSRLLLAALLGIVAIVAVGVWSCGTSGYDTPNYSPPAPVLTQTINGLINAATLKGWMDQGLVNATTGEKVVVLDYTDQTTYDTGHIPGAVRVDVTEILQTRLEGVGEMAQLVVDGAHMDAIIKKAGINANTTLVLTGSSISNATRLYVTLRYWGFPKSRLKVLDGINSDWKASYTMSTITPTIQRSTYSVTPDGINRVQAQLRVSLGEMMDVVQYFDGTKQAIIDVLSNPASVLGQPITAGNVTATPPVLPSSRPSNMYKGFPGSTAGLLPYAVSTTTEYVVFEGHMKNGVNLNQATLYASNKFYPVDDGTANSLKSKFNAVGMDGTKTAYVYCRAGNAAAVGFFALDGILNWNVVWYDGSWGQWGLMADKKGGKLKAGSIWSTYPLSVSDPVPDTVDTLQPRYVQDATDGVTYNIDNTPLPTVAVPAPAFYKIQPLPYFQNLDDTFTSVTDPAANQVESADKAYISPVTTSSGGASSSGNSGGGC
ncbi:MAG: selenite/tellurite reduction operon rhodanese-like protein ExtH [Syntrophales bacterium]|nr:selenite/tellurite reduction operon rhodanese-like protein ExtH [Syntrophales bacterium]